MDKFVAQVNIVAKVKRPVPNYLFRIDLHRFEATQKARLHCTKPCPQSLECSRCSVN